MMIMTAIISASCGAPAAKRTPVFCTGPQRTVLEEERNGDEGAEGLNLTKLIDDSDALSMDGELACA